MWLKYIISIFLFFIFGIIQNSFLSHINIAGAVPNLIFILFFVSVFLGDFQGFYESIFISILAGLIIDLFSPFYFGSGIVSFLLIGFFIKTVLHFMEKRQDGYLLFYLVPLFLISLVVYDLLIRIFLDFSHTPFTANYIFFIELAYNLALTIVVFFIYQYIAMRPKKDKQLILFR